MRGQSISLLEFVLSSEFLYLDLVLSHHEATTAAEFEGGLQLVLNEAPAFGCLALKWKEPRIVRRHQLRWATGVDRLDMQIARRCARALAVRSAFFQDNRFLPGFRQFVGGGRSEDSPADHDRVKMLSQLLLASAHPSDERSSR